MTFVDAGKSTAVISFPLIFRCSAQLKVTQLFEFFSGHIFCFLCLRSAVAGNIEDRVRASCPTCGKPISTSPSAPSKSIEKLVQMLVSTKTDEVQEKHRHRMIAVNLRVRAIHKKCDDSPWDWLKHQEPVHDLDDGLFRCPVCTWELASDGSCSSNECTYIHVWELEESEIAGRKC